MANLTSVEVSKWENRDFSKVEKDIVLANDGT